MASIKINIDLTKIAESKKFREGSNKHKYIDLIISDRREPDTRGNTHTVSISKNKDERDQATVYVGDGKTLAYTGSQTNVSSNNNTSLDESLPF